MYKVNRLLQDCYHGQECVSCFCKLLHVLSCDQSVVNIVCLGVSPRWDTEQHILLIITLKTENYIKCGDRFCWLYMDFESFIFWDIIMCTLPKVSWHVERTCCLHRQGWRIREARNRHEGGSSQTLLPVCFMLVSCLAYSSTLKMEVTHCSETMVDFHWTTQHNTLEDRTLHNHHCENLKSYVCLYSCIFIH
jgi:hypothetical protein